MVTLEPTLPSLSPQEADPNPSLFEQVNSVLQQASAPYLPLSVPFVGNGQQSSPLVAGLPSALTSYEKKYTQDLPVLSDLVSSGQIPSHAVHALNAYDLHRVQQGKAPLNPEQTYGALQTIATGQAHTQEPGKSAWSIPANLGSDAKTIFTSIPHLLDPRTYIKEAKAITQFPEELNRSIQEGENPIEAIAHAPGIRLIPGAYTVGNLAGGKEGIHEALTHPLMTGLDLYAADALAGKVAGIEHGGLVGTAVKSSAAGAKVSEWRTILNDYVKSTRPGQYAEAQFGAINRALSRTAALVAHQVAEGLNPLAKSDPTIIDPELVATQVARQTTKVHSDWDNLISDERKTELADAAVLDRNNLPSDVTPEERGYIDDAIKGGDAIRAYHVGNGDLEELVTSGQMDVFDPSTAETIKKAWKARDRYDVFTHVRQAVRYPQAILSEDLAALTPKVGEFLVDARFSALERARLGRGYGYAVRGINGTLPDGYLRAIADREFDTAKSLLADHTPTFDLPLTAREQTIRKQWETLTRKYTPARNASAKAIVSKVETENIPARWRATRDQLVSGKVVDKIEAMGRARDIDVGELIQQAVNRDYYRLADEGFINADDIRTYIDEAKATIADIRQAGIVDPVYIHYLSHEQIPSIDYPQPLRGSIRGKVDTPSQLKPIAEVSQPYVHNLSVSLNHQAKELLDVAAQKTFYQELLRTVPNAERGESVAPFARTQADLDRIYGGIAKARQAFNPNVDVRGLIDARIKKEWVKFPTAQLPAEVKDALGLADEMGEHHPYIPKSVYRNLELISKPRDMGVLDPILHTFRTSLLGLSPRFVLYQMIGDALQVMAQSNPITVWKYLRDARQMVVDETLPATLKPIIGHVNDPLTDWHFKSGTKLAKLVGDESIFKKITDRTYKTVSFFTDTYTAMSYLYGFDEALAKGLTKVQAEAAGEALVRKSLMTWDEMTAMERSSLRYIFPFYGWAQHILSYVAKYPVDHPFRAAVTASIARNELADLGTGLPTNLLNMLFLGEPDKNGHVKAINTAGMNPFRDVANFTTLAGWLNSTNPVIAGLLKSAGLDSFSGGPELYPNLQYDPDTGRLQAKSENPLMAILHQTIPQSEILTGLLAKSSEFKDLMRQDPSAAMRMIASQAGLPIIERDLPVDRNQIQGEVTRQQAQQAALNEAQKSGDYTDAAKWPALKVTINQVQGLQSSGALSQFQPGAPNNVAKIAQIQQMIAQSVP